MLKIIIQTVDTHPSVYLLLQHELYQMLIPFTKYHNLIPKGIYQICLFMIEQISRFCTQYQISKVQKNRSKSSIIIYPCGGSISGRAELIYPNLENVFYKPPRGPLSEIKHIHQIRKKDTQYCLKCMSYQPINVAFKCGQSMTSAFYIEHNSEN